MQSIVDAFIQAVEDARRELIRREGRNISIRSLIRRAGFDEAKRSGVAYHLNPNRHRGERPHRVPVDVIERLAQVLPISEEELSRAAAIASGLNVVDMDVTANDVRYVVSRFYGSDEVTPEERAAATAHILQVIAEETTKQQRGTAEVAAPRDERPRGGSPHRVPESMPTFLAPAGEVR